MALKENKTLNAIGISLAALIKKQTTNSCKNKTRQIAKHTHLITC